MYRKICLAAFVFTCGWVLMGLEMVGPRIMAPVFGSDIYAWGSIISTFMVALSVGYWAGGKVTRSWNSHWTLSVIAITSAVFIVILNYIHRPLNDWLFDVWIERFVGPDIEEVPSMRWPTLISSFVLFFLPSVLLGMISPVAIRLATSDVDRVGESAGRLYAISTAGSCLGVLVTSFHLVGAYTNHTIFLGYAALLAIAGILFGILFRFGGTMNEIQMSKPDNEDSKDE